MSAKWPRVRLGEVLRHRKEFVTIDDLQTYRRPRVQLHVQGIVLRDEVPGALIKTKKQQVCRTGEFLVAEIDAKVGGFGMVPMELDGAIVSSHYFLYEVNEARLDRRFLGWFIKTPTFREQVAAQGTTNYAAIRPADVLGYEMLLPPLAEQRRVVARIEELARKIADAQELRRQSNTEVELLESLATASLFDNVEYEKRPLGSLLRERSRNGLSARPTDASPGVPILRISAGTSRADGLVEESDYRYLDVPEDRVEEFCLQPGDLLSCRFNGNLRYVGRFSLFSGETRERRLYPDKLIRFRVDTARILPEYVRSVMNSPFGRSRIETFCQTTAGNIGISAGNLNTIPIPVPPLAEQRRIVAYIEGVQTRSVALKRLQAETDAELDALTPAILDRAFKGEL